MRLRSLDLSSQEKRTLRRDLIVVHNLFTQESRRAGSDLFSLVIVGRTESVSAEA